MTQVRSEAHLVSRLRQQDPAAFEIVVRRYSDRLLAVAARFLRSKEDRADALQDAFLRAFRSISRFEGRARLSTWLHRILVNVCLGKIRARSRNPAVPLDDLLPPGDGHDATREPAVIESPTDPITSAETCAQLRACIDRLPPSYRTVIELRDLEELDTDQTAQTIGATRGMVKARLHRARRALRSLLAPSLGQA
jgi:RNA polymerase sigma-70 factor (ECF subfamily)